MYYSYSINELFSHVPQDGYGGDNYDDDDVGGGPADMSMTDMGASQQAITFGGDSLVVPPNKVGQLGYAVSIHF